MEFYTTLIFDSARPEVPMEKLHIRLMHSGKSSGPDGFGIEFAGLRTPVG